MKDFIYREAAIEAIEECESRRRRNEHGMFQLRLSVSCERNIKL